MKYLIKSLILSSAILPLVSLTSCAAGAATAGYAIKAQSADSVTASCEQRIIDRAKKEIMADIARNTSYISRDQNESSY